ncbi:MAG: S9 family peptidase, partial [Deltaproteobacteria bacterium]|nr:S9 family peptidase [Deltaproteobacteria bacterium]
MNTIKLSSYGSWRSPIKAEIVASTEVGLEQVRVDGSDLYWIERRAQEGGRKAIVQRSADGKITDITPAPFNTRTRVHEYGGGDYTVADDTIVFANFTDQRLYIQKPGSRPTPLTPEAKIRYADGEIDRRRNVVFCVREDHEDRGEAVNSLVRVSLLGGDTGEVVVCGNDFYSSPRLSPDGSRLAWLTWNHPNMPWDGTELWVGTMNDDGSLREQRCIAGSSSESIFQPEWSPDGILHFVSDISGWWNLYRCLDNRIEPLCPMAAEFGQPQWVFGSSLYTFVSENQLICSYSRNGRDYLASLDTDTKTLRNVNLPFPVISQVHAARGGVVFIGASPTESTSIVALDLASNQWQVLHRSRESSI